MKCKDCNNFSCDYRNTLEKCFYQDDYLDKDFNWKSFRAEAAKDILCAIIHKTNNFIGKDSAGYAIMIADELINKLKEKEESQNV